MGGSEKEKLPGFPLKHSPTDLTGAGGGTFNYTSESSYDFSIGDFTQNFPDFPAPNDPTYPEFPPFPPFGDFFYDPSGTGPDGSGPGTPALYYFDGSQWILLIPDMSMLNPLGTTLPDWFDVHEEDDGATHVIAIDDTPAANPLVLRIADLPTSDPGGGQVWLSPT